MRSSFTKIAAALFFAIALFSCNFDTMGSDKGAITMRLPDQSQLNAIASSGALAEVSRSVSSGGSISAGAVDQFKVVVRNISSHESITQFVAPGSSVTVDELEPGSWDVAIFGYDTAGTSGDPIYYGNARGIPVEGGETSNATVGLYNISANMPGFGFNVTPAANVNYAYINYSCDELGQNGEAFYSFDSSSYDPTKPLMPPLPIFMEPGYAYKATANFYDLSGKCLYKGTAQGTVPPTGGTIDGIQIPLAETFEINTNGINGNMVLEQDSDDFYKQYITHSLNSNPISDLDLDNVKYRAVAKNCGMVPFVVTYGDYSCVFVRSVWHPVITPTINVPSLTVQKGQTITVSPSFNPSAPRTWQVFGESATATDGFKLYTVTGSEHDAWTHALSCADPNADKVNFNDANKTLTGAAVGSNNFRWTVTVEPVYGGSGEPGTKNVYTDFTATCVVPTQPSGGGSGSVPPAGFVEVEGMTIPDTGYTFTSQDGYDDENNVFVSGRGYPIVIHKLWVSAFEVSQREYGKYMKYQRGFSSDSDPKYYDVPDDDIAAHDINWTEAIIYCNLRSSDEGVQPVYYILLDSSGAKTKTETSLTTREYNVANWVDKFSYQGGNLIMVQDGKYFTNGNEPSGQIGDLHDYIRYDDERNGYRLPTEAEWEYCARGGKDGMALPQGMSGGGVPTAALSTFANNGGGTFSRNVLAGGTLDPNLLGLYDMLGNVSEWCWDKYYSNVKDSRVGPYGLDYDTYEYCRVARGGHKDDTSWNVRIYYRGYHIYCDVTNTGFRVVRTIGD